jgi:glycosyltransferase 2 family protein
VKAKSLLHIAATIVMLGIVLGMADIGRLKHTFFSVPPHLIALVMLGYVVSPLLNCYRWLLFARGAGVQASYLQVVRAYFLGAFVNSFALGMVGGDLARALVLADKRPVRAQAIASVAADRLHGLAVIALIGSFAALFFGHEHVPDWLLTLLASIAPSIIVCWLAGPVLMVRLFPKSRRLQAKFVSVANAFPKDLSLLLPVTGVSILFHLFQISLHRLMGYGVGVEIPYGTLLFVVPFVNIVSSLPISWQGLGVRETAYIFFLYPHVLTREEAIAFGFIWLLAVTSASAVGGILAALTPGCCQLWRQKPETTNEPNSERN